MTPQEQWECDHYDVCHVVHISKNHICPSNPDNKTCDYDTRSHPNTPSASDIKKQIKEIRELAQFTKQAWDERESTIRNQTLDEIRKHAINAGIVGFDDKGKIRSYRYINPKILLQKIESLRHQSTEARK